jgi:hypothetical protein
MVARLDYLSKTKNRVVALYSSDGAGGGATFDVGPNAFGATGIDPIYATTGLTFSSAALSRVVGSCGGSNGNIELQFYGTTNYNAFVIPFSTVCDVNLERITIPNYAAGTTGLFVINNKLGGGATASVMLEFVTRQVS